MYKTDSLLNIAGSLTAQVIVGVSTINYARGNIGFWIWVLFWVIGWCIYNFSYNLQNK